MRERRCCYSIVFIAGIIVYRIIIVKNPKLRRRIKARLSTAIYGIRASDCVLSRSQRLIGCYALCYSVILLIFDGLQIIFTREEFLHDHRH